MKPQILIIALLLGLLVIGTTIGKTYMPEWALAISVFAILVYLIYYILVLYSKEKSFFEEKLNTLNSNIEESKEELFKRQNAQTTELTNLIVDRQNSLQQLVSNSVDSLNNESAKRTALVIEQLTAKTAEIEKLLKNEAEIINALSETNKKLFSQVISKIAADSDKIEKLLSQMSDLLKNEGENTRKVIVEASTSVSSLLSAQKEEIENAIVASTASIVTKVQEHSDSFSSTVSQLSVQAVSSREAMSNTLTDIQQASKELRLIIENNQETVTDCILQNNKVLTESIEKGLAETSNIITNDFGEIQLAVKESNDFILQTVKEHYDGLNNLIGTVSDKNDVLNQILETSVPMLSNKLDETKEQAGELIKTVDVINQQNVSLQEAVKSCSELVVNAKKNINSSISQHKTDMIEQIQQSAENVSGNVDGYVANAVASLTPSIIEVKEACNNTEYTLQNIATEQTKEIKQTIKDVEVQYTNLIQKLENTQDLLSLSSEKLNENIATSINNVKECVVSETAKNVQTISDVITDEVSKISQSIDNASKISNDNVGGIVEYIAEGNTSLSNKVDSLEKQAMTLFSDLKNMNEPDSQIKDSLKSIQEQCFSMQRGLAGVQIQSNNVEKAIDSFVSKNANDEIIESIKILIDNLHKELKSSVSDINEELLETQIKQESTNDQLDKLQTLLRNIPASSSSAQPSVVVKTPTIHASSPTKTNKPVVISTLKAPVSPLPAAKPDKKQSEEKSKLTTVRPTTVKQELNPNRTENIVDPQTNNLVINKFVDGELTKSTMKDAKGHLLYEVDYKNGKIVRSRNYDKKGNVNIEQTYYDNGQVHFRNEITKKGKITTEFDRNGNRK